MSKIKVGDKVKVKTTGNKKFAGEVHHILGEYKQNPLYGVLIKKDYTGENRKLIGAILVCSQKEVTKI